MMRMNLIMSNEYRLIQIVLSHSKSQEWDNAVEEWKIWDYEEDSSCERSCICGKEHIKYLFRICNKVNGNMLFPIGSSCIRKFGRLDLNEEVDIVEGIFKLLHVVRDNEFIELSSEYFSRKIINWLYDECAFDNEYNDYEGTADYEFFLKMFNKRDKYLISSKQWSKIRAIIAYSLKPFLEEKLADKMK